ncbi:MAG: PAS domain S-box protein [Elusimicrobia bacterium]|nr:PAS domain S-box protein [Elusimicrobiota bacterium]
MPIKIRWNNLGIKLSLVFSTLMAISSTVLVISSYLAEKDLLMKESMARFQSITVNLAFNSEYGILTHNVPTLSQIASGVMREKDVNNVKVMDDNGAVLIEMGRSRQPSYLTTHPVLTQKMYGGGVDVDSLLGPISITEPGAQPSTGPEAHESGQSSQLEEIGSVQVEFDLAPTQGKLARIRRYAIGLSALFVLLGILLTNIFVRVIILPLKELVNATKRIAGGEMEVQVAARTRDEIGELASAFNIMTQNLKKSTVSRDYLDSILDSIPDSIVVTDPDGTVNMVNQGTTALSGYSEGELVGQSIDRIVSISDNIYVTKEGEKIPVSISEGVIRGDSGQLKGTVYVIHDMRPIKKLQERLLQSEKMAAVGQLAAGVSHEINNPLGVILGFAQGLVRRLSSGDPLELPLKSIEREATRCKNLVQDLLTFSRTTHAEREPMDLNVAVEGAISLIQAQARMDKTDVRRDLSESIPRILGNKNQLQQVVINLANNALDAMPKGGVLSVKTELIEDRPHSWVCLKVADNGFGIAPEIMPRIFDPFFTTKPVGKGTGLGLSLVYEIIKKHSGTIEVQSRPGLTEFIIKFPARTGRENDQYGLGTRHESTMRTPPAERVRGSYDG